MNTLHDRFPDFDFGEDGQATNNSKIVMYYYILKQPRQVPWKEGVLILNSDYLADVCGWVFYFRREADGCFQ